MPDLSPTITGMIRNSHVNFSDGFAWRDHLPLLDSTGTSVTDDANFIQEGLYSLFGYIGNANITTSDTRVIAMSFDTSAITSAESVKLRIWGHTNSGVGDPNGGSNSGMVVVQFASALGSTTSLATSDWGKLDNSSSQPTLLSDTLTSWNTGTTTPNTFTLNSTAISAINSGNTFQIAVCHRFFYDFSVTAQPFAFGSNSPNGDNDFTAIAGAYIGMGDDDTYKPVLSIAGPHTQFLTIKSGIMNLKGGSFTIK